jgi:hypothetical protein
MIMAMPLWSSSLLAMLGRRKALGLLTTLRLLTVLILL